MKVDASVACAQGDDPSWLKEYRRAAADLVGTLPGPRMRYGLSIQMRPHLDLSYEVIAKALTTPAVTINSSDAITVRERIADDDKIFFAKDWQEQEDDIYLNALHDAVSGDVKSVTRIIEIPSDYRSTDPIELDTKALDANQFVNYLVRVGKGSEVRILLTSLGTGMLSVRLRIVADDASKVEVFSLQRMDRASLQVQERKALIGKDAKVDWRDVCLGGRFVKSTSVSFLRGQGSQTTNTVLYLASDDQQHDIYTGAHHEASDTYADIVTKGAINKKAKALSTGLIRIGAAAARSSGYEQQDALILSDDAEADAIPNLEIHNHDVKCSHGSTVGQVDQGQLFYLMSRGISQERAKHMIIKGFFAPIISKFDAATQEAIGTMIDESLES